MLELKTNSIKLIRYVVRELSKCADLKLVSRLEFSPGAVAMRYEPRR